MKKSQIQFVKQKLREDSKISRNLCLSLFISRLGAIINLLKKEGWEIEGQYEKTPYGKDYVYYAVKKPYIPKFIYSETKRAMVEVIQQEKLI